MPTNDNNDESVRDIAKANMVNIKALAGLLVKKGLLSKAEILKEKKRIEAEMKNKKRK